MPFLCHSFMIETIFKLLTAGLNLWSDKEKNKYLDQMINLKRAFYEEYNKPEPDSAVLDNIRLELRLLCDSFSSQVGIASTKD